MCNCLEWRNHMTFLILSLLFYLLQNFGNKEFNRRSKDVSFKEKSLIQNGVCVLIASFVMLLAGGGKIMSLPLMLMAVLFGICYLLTIFLLLRSFDGGTLGTSTLLCNLGMFISAMYGVIRFNDKFTFKNTNFTPTWKLVNNKLYFCKK